MKHVVHLHDAQQGRQALLRLWEVVKPWLIAGHRLHVVATQENKSRAQEERYHAMIRDIARQWQFSGQFWHEDDMKRLLIDLFAETMRQLGKPLHHDGRVVPSIDGKRVVQLGIQSKDFYKSEASDFIEFLFAFGAEREIKWTEA